MTYNWEGIIYDGTVQQRCATCLSQHRTDKSSGPAGVAGVTDICNNSNGHFAKLQLVAQGHVTARSVNTYVRIFLLVKF